MGFGFLLGALRQLLLCLPLGAKFGHRARRFATRWQVWRRDLAGALAFQVREHCAARIGGDR